MLHRPQGQKAVWPTALPCQIALPADCSPGDLLEVLEFAQVGSSVCAICLCRLSVPSVCAQHADQTPKGPVWTVLVVCAPVFRMLLTAGRRTVSSRLLQHCHWAQCHAVPVLHTTVGMLGTETGHLIAKANKSTLLPTLCTCTCHSGAWAHPMHANVDAHKAQHKPCHRCLVSICHWLEPTQLLWQLSWCRSPSLARHLALAS